MVVTVSSKLALVLHPKSHKSRPKEMPGLDSKAKKVYIYNPSFKMVNITGSQHATNPNPSFSVSESI